MERPSQLLSILDMESSINKDDASSIIRIVSISHFKKVLI